MFKSWSKKQIWRKSDTEEKSENASHVTSIYITADGKELWTPAIKSLEKNRLIKVQSTS